MAIVQTDDALIRATRTGDAEAFGEITRRHVGRVYTMCLRMTGEPGTAEALTESVFLSAYTEAALLQVPIQSWLLQRALAACEDPPESSSPASEDEPDTETEDDVQAQQLQAALDGLSPSFRASIILRDVLELDYDQVADIMNLPTGTARSRVHRARLDMASALSQTSHSRSKSKSKYMSKSKSKSKAD